MADIFNAIRALSKGIDFEMSADYIEELDESLDVLVINHAYYNTLVASAILDYRNHPAMSSELSENVRDTYNLILTYLGVGSLCQWLTDLVNQVDMESSPDAPPITPIYAVVEEIVSLSYSSDAWVLTEILNFSFDEYDKPEDYEFLGSMAEVLEEQLEPFIPELATSSEGVAYQALIELMTELEELYNYFAEGAKKWAVLDGEDPDDTPLIDLLESFDGGQHIREFTKVMDRINTEINVVNPYFRN